MIVVLICVTGYVTVVVIVFLLGVIFHGSCRSYYRCNLLWDVVAVVFHIIIIHIQGNTISIGPLDPSEAV